MTSSTWRWSTTPPACSARCGRKGAWRRFGSWYACFVRVDACSSSARCRAAGSARCCHERRAVRRLSRRATRSRRSKRTASSPSGPWLNGKASSSSRGSSRGGDTVSRPEYSVPTRFRPNRQDSPSNRPTLLGRSFAALPNAMKASLLTIAFALLVTGLNGQQPQAPVRPDADARGYRFKSGVELINVTATVADINGRFVPGLTQDDFLVYEDDRPVA